MAGISQNAKNSNLPEFGDSVSAGSKALCGLTEAAAQVKAKVSYWSDKWSTPPDLLCYTSVLIVLN